MWKVQPIAPVKSVMYRSPDPKNMFAYSPGICALENGRLIGTMDIGGKLAPENCGRIFVSEIPI